MKTLLIKDVEEVTGKKVRQFAFSIGVDIAVLVTGLCLLRTDKEKIYIESLQTIETNTKDDAFHRTDNLISSLDKLKQDIEKYKEYKLLIIEDCFFGANVDILKHLARFGIIVYRELKKNVDAYYFFYPSQARSLIGFNLKNQTKTGNVKAEIYSRDTKNKEGKILHKKGDKKKISVKNLVDDYLKIKFGVEIEEENERDSFVLSMCGILK